ARRCSRSCPSARSRSSPAAPTRSCGRRPRRSSGARSPSWSRADVARILFVVPPLVGHTNPTVSVAAALGALGHAVAWAAPPDKAAPLLPPRARILSLGACDESVFAPILERSRRVRGLEGLQFLWRDFLVPLARAMLPPLGVAVPAARPGLRVVDPPPAPPPPA